MATVVIEVSVPQTSDILAVAETVDVVADPAGAQVIIVAAPGPPGPRGSAGAGFVWVQATPVAVVDITHNLGRDGPVIAEYWSLDYSIQWDNVVTQRLSADVARVSFDSPTAFIAIIL